MIEFELIDIEAIGRLPFFISIKFKSQPQLLWLSKLGTKLHYCFNFMKSTSICLKNHILTIIQVSIISCFLISISKSVLASECPYSNFMVVDGQCVNLDPQMKTTKKTKVTNPLSDLDELTGSSIATYGSLLSLLGGSVAGYKFLVRK